MSAAPVMQARDDANAAAQGDEMVRYDSETVIAPRSVSPSRRRNASRCNGGSHLPGPWPASV